MKADTASMGRMAQREKIRWGMLGTGYIAARFAEGLQFVPDAKLMAIGSRKLESAQEFAGRHGVPAVYASYQEVVADPNVDVVYIATPNSRHKEDCLLCIEAGKSVLCEKPFAMNASDAREITERAKAKGVFFMEAMWMRFIPSIQKAAELIRRGDIGKPCFLTADFGFPIQRDPENRFLNLKLGGGSLLDRGIYPISLACLLFGKPQAVTGQASIAETGVDDQCMAVLNFANGIQAALISSLNAFGTNRAVIVGTHGQLELHDPFFQTDRITVTQFPVSTPNPIAVAGGRPKASALNSGLIKKIRRAALRLVGKNPDQTAYLIPKDGNGYNYEAAEVHRCLRKGTLESPIMPWAESIEVISIMDTLRRQWGVKYPNDPVA